MQWTSWVSSRSASVRLRAVRTRIGLPSASSRSWTIGAAVGSSSISSRVSVVWAVPAPVALTPVALTPEALTPEALTLVVLTP